MTQDFEPEIPPANIHPTIYIVRLGRNESTRWEADPQYRAEQTANFQRRAQRRGKKTIEVHGRYNQLAQIEVGE